ncbi:MAG: alpha/beta hydrolase [Pseudomonadota bacterium]
MQNTDYFDAPSGRRLAYAKTTGKAPGVVFLGGFMSDMQGTKAIYLEEWAKREGRAFLRFDYSGHGESSGEFADGCIGDWAEDAQEAIAHLTKGPQVLVGSSMGGWISLRYARDFPDRVAGLVTIAAAPDFTEDSMWASFSEEQRQVLMKQGKISLPSDYDEPYTITRRLIEDGRNQLVLRAPLALNFPVRFLQGTEDADVDMSVALRLLEHATGPDMELLLVKGADHRFSDKECLKKVELALVDVISRAI